MQVSPRFCITSSFTRYPLAAIFNDPNRKSHLRCNRSLPSCSRCTICRVPCIHTIATTEPAYATPPESTNSQGTRVDFRDNRSGLGAYERPPTVSTFMSAGRTSMDYPFNGSEPVGSPYDQTQIPTMGGHLSNGSSHTSPFVTSPTPIPSDSSHNHHMEPATTGADILETFDHSAQPATTFENNGGGVAVEGHASTAFEQRLNDIGWDDEQQERIFHPNCESQ